MENYIANLLIVIAFALLIFALYVVIIRAVLRINTRIRLQEKTIRILEDLIKEIKFLDRK